MITKKEQSEIAGVLKKARELMAKGNLDTPLTYITIAFADMFFDKTNEFSYEKFYRESGQGGRE